MMDHEPPLGTRTLAQNEDPHEELHTHGIETLLSSTAVLCNVANDT